MLIDDLPSVVIRPEKERACEEVVGGVGRGMDPAMPTENSHPKWLGRGDLEFFLLTHGSQF